MNQFMEPILLLSIMIKIAFICLQICIITGTTVLLATTCFKRDSLEEEDSAEDLRPKPSQEVMKSPAQKAAIAKIRQGQMMPANQNETVDDAISNWGNVQKIEGYTYMADRYVFFFGTDESDLLIR
uniref:Uncharacterized protein n=1 Tax=Setaria digitata TaxID=48799 RepID=A0A915PPD5_9BILA